MELSDFAIITSDNARSEDPKMIVSDILKQIPEDAARLLLQYYIGGESQAALAKQMQVQVGTVKSRLFYAKKHFKEKCPPEILSIYERGSNMKKDDMILNFPKAMPELTIEKANYPFFEVKFEEDTFIIPRIGNKNAEGTYRYPDKNLALVSTCYVPKKAKKTLHRFYHAEFFSESFCITRTDPFSQNKPQRWGCTA